MALQRTYNFKIYDQSGSTLVKNISTEKPEDGSMFCKNAPSFRSRINGGQGELVLDLFADFDDFEEGTTIKMMNIVKVFAVTITESGGVKTQTETLIYTGFISKYEAFIEGGDQGVRVTCLGLVSLLTFSFYADADLTVAHATEDPTVIGKAVITHFNTVYSGSLLSYDASSIPATVGQTVSATFTDAYWFDCIRKVGELAGANWWWFFDQNGKYLFKAKPGTSTHVFTIGKDIESLSCPKDSEKVVNDLYVRRDGGTETHYEDTGSQSEFGTGSPATGLRSKIVSDSSLTSEDAADQFGEKLVNDESDSKVKATLVINSSYDLESIQIGETANVRNYSGDSTFFPDGMLIVGLTYSGTSVALELEGHSSDFGLELQSFVEAA